MRKGLITTNDQGANPQPVAVPRKLNIITSAIIPNAKPQPEPKGTDLSKMITTHDIGDEVILREVPRDRVEVKIGELIPLDESEPKKKAGRPKKEK